MRVQTCMSAVVLVAALGRLAGGAPPAAAETNAWAINAAWVAARYQADLAAHGADPDRLVRPGLIADRTARTVRLWADATGIGVHDPLEFLLIGESSGHSYESIAVSHAAPSALDEALRFIGLTPGRGPAPQTFVFWPRGERVRLTVARQDPDDAATGSPPPIPVERLLWNTRANTPVPDGTGFVFLGAGWVPARDPQAPPVFVPDVRDPRSLVSLYNAAYTVLDVPRAAPQGTVYGQQAANPAHLLPAGALLVFTLTPERPPDAPPRVRDLTLHIHPPLPDAARPGEARFAWSGPATDPPSEPLRTAGEVEADAARWVAEGADLHTAIRFDRDLRLDEARAVSLWLETVDREDALRIEPPPAGQLFYRAFNPNPENRRREDRVAQPFELHLALPGAPADTNAPAETPAPAWLAHLEEVWSEDRLDPQLVVTESPVADPDTLTATLAGLAGLPVILVYAPAELTVGAVLDWVMPQQATHPLVHVYLDPDPAAPVTPDQISDPVP